MDRDLEALRFVGPSQLDRDVALESRGVVVFRARGVVTATG
ncbi:hypothetical protein [Microbacterium sp. PAMC 28756]|nr:hypothetical protein [Microbacterium sp. PAMC 28756]